MARYTVLFMVLILIINDIFSLPVCEQNLQNTLNTCQCSPLRVSSTREIINHDWVGTTELLPGVAYWTDAILVYTPWIQYGGCWATSKPQTVLDKLGVRLSEYHPITECLQYVTNSSFYLWGSRCIDQESIGILTDQYCEGVPCNSTVATFYLTGQRQCVCKYDAIALPTVPGLGNCKSVSFSFNDDNSDTWNATLNNVNCDSTFPVFCVGRDSSRQKVAKEFKFFEEEIHDLGNATRICSLYHFDIVSTIDMTRMPIDFRNHFINNSRSYWTSMFREEKLMLGHDRHVYDTDNCLSVMSDHNQNLLWSVRSCPLVISNATNCTLESDTTDASTNVTSERISKPNQNMYFLFVLVVPVIIVVGCIDRQCLKKKTTRYPHTQYKSTMKHQTEQCVIGEDKTDTEYLHTHNSTTSPKNMTYQYVEMTPKISKTECKHVSDLEPKSSQMEETPSLMEAVPILHEDGKEEPHYMDMRKPVESLYVTLQLLNPRKSPNTPAQTGE